MKMNEVDSFDDEIYEAISRDMNMQVAQLEGKTTFVMEKGYGMNGLKLAENACMEIAKSNEPCFEWVTPKGKRSYWKKTTVGHLLGQFKLAHEVRRRDVRYSPHLNLLFETMDKTYFMQELIDRPDALSVRGDTTAQRLNEFVEMLREEMRKPSFREEVAKRQNRADKNFKSGIAFTEGLFSVFSRLLVMRVDLLYKKGEETDIKVARADLARLLKNRKNKPSLFEHVVGYIRKLEFGGQGRGYHFHFIIFMDGSKVQRDFYRGEEIGKYWAETITKGRGDYWNCNRDKRKYKNLGIGMIHHSDQAMRLNLIEVLRYLTKKDYYVRPEMDDGRSFATSQVPPKNAKSGRTRKDASFIFAVSEEAPNV